MDRSFSFSFYLESGYYKYESWWQWWFIQNRNTGSNGDPIQSRNPGSNGGPIQSSNGDDNGGLHSN